MTAGPSKDSAVIQGEVKGWVLVVKNVEVR